MLTSKTHAMTRYVAYSVFSINYNVMMNMYAEYWIYSLYSKGAFEGNTGSL